jgi:hypothetical protein
MLRAGSRRRCALPLPLYHEHRRRHGSSDVELQHICTEELLDPSAPHQAHALLLAARKVLGWPKMHSSGNQPKRLKLAQHLVCFLVDEDLGVFLTCVV